VVFSSSFIERLDGAGLRVSEIKYRRLAPTSCSSSVTPSFANSTSALRKGRPTSSQRLPPRPAPQYCSQARRKARARILGRSSCPESVDIELGPRSADRSEVPDCSRNEDTQPRKNAKPPRLVLMLKLSTDYPQAHSNRAATKREHDTGPSVPASPFCRPTSPARRSGRLALRFNRDLGEPVAYVLTGLHSRADRRAVGA
jgi:hypothetical protein